MIDVSLFLRGEKLDPSTITKISNLSPSSSQSKGEKRVTSSKEEYTTKNGIWELAVNSSSDKLSDHINELALKLSKDNIVFNNLEGVEDAYLDVFMAADAEDGEGTCEFELTNENITNIAKLGLPIRFTICISKE